jgi:hypothetical protein
MSAMSREWAFSMAFSLFLMLVFGMGLVWLNIERVDMAYEITRLQGEIDQATALAAKLEVERDTLITPGRLRELAVQFGLGPAKSGQIRWIGDNGEALGESRRTQDVQVQAATPEVEKTGTGKAKAGRTTGKAPAQAAKPAAEPQDAYEN